MYEETPEREYEKPYGHCVRVCNYSCDITFVLSSDEMKTIFKFKMSTPVVRSQFAWAVFITDKYPNKKQKNVLNLLSMTNIV